MKSQILSFMFAWVIEFSVFLNMEHYMYKFVI